MRRMSLIRFKSLAALTLIAGAPLGCARSSVPGSGVSKTETRQVDTFDEIRFLGQGRVEITIGEPQSVKLSGDDNLLPLIKTEVRDNRLIIKPLRKIRPKLDLVLTVSVADLKALSFAGAGSADLQGVDNDRLALRVSGAAQVSASGRTRKLTITIEGVGNVQTEHLEAGDVSLDITGAGNADVRASDNLNVTITGAGAVRYTGDPKVTKKIMGAGSVAKQS